ncbi:hypothetical protein HMPREF0631_1868 [Peptostreptococcus anaerobius 653-L]|uniref:Uncharacterized protein n=1 Tax=Peptostreptococcus anaerobius 653-L TaxID=596329 RepID=D3MS03_9FIRM|nr:hypothetical protein [Peptostreptococcus anaerobius]EFD05161.1 hypothetical protein HMPREF0631_1868 [Peptostreptococcus anaerobius 653-L]
MQFIHLDLQTRYNIYTHTKRVLRKYQKGIISGKLTSDQFVDNMLRDKSIVEILNRIPISSKEFRSTYKDYVDKLIDIQNETLAANKYMSKTNSSSKAEYSSIFKLNKLLKDSGFYLSMPTQYLSQKDIESIEKFIMTGKIDLGEEKIYHYVCK